MAGCGRLRLSP